MRPTGIFKESLFQKLPNIEGNFVVRGLFFEGLFGQLILNSLILTNCIYLLKKCPVICFRKKKVFSSVVQPFQSSLVLERPIFDNYPTQSCGISPPQD